MSLSIYIGFSIKVYKIWLNFTYVEPLMNALGHKKKPCEETNIFASKMESENGFKNRGCNFDV